ncbi:MAG: hypothetical protein ACREV8_15165, partial [Gammaproteobacteria bacterium]
MGPSIDGGSRIGPPMPHHFVWKYRATRGKVTRQTPQTPRNRPQSAAQLATLNNPRPLKTGNIVR